jgi:hypothetical protein
MAQEGPKHVGDKFYIAFTVHFHLVCSNQQVHTLKLFYSFISITEFPYTCFGP